MRKICATIAITEEERQKWQQDASTLIEATTAMACAKIAICKNIMSTINRVKNLKIKVSPAKGKKLTEKYI